MRRVKLVRGGTYIGYGLIFNTGDFADVDDAVGKSLLKVKDTKGRDRFEVTNNTPADAVDPEGAPVDDVGDGVPVDDDEPDGVDEIGGDDETDEDTPMTAAELRAELKEYNITPKGNPSIATLNTMLVEAKEEAAALDSEDTDV